MFGVCFVGVKVTLSQPAPTFPASQAQTTAGVVGAPFYLTPRSIQYIPFIATNLNPVFVTNLVNGSSNLLVTTSFPTNELWVDPVKGSSLASGAYATPLDNLTNALPLIIARGGGTIHLTPGTTNAILTANNIVSNVYIDGRGATIIFAATNAASPGVFVVNGNATFSDFKYYGITNDFQLPFDFTLNLANNSTIVFDNLYVFNATDVIYDNGGTARTGISILVNNCRFESYFDNIIITGLTAPTLRFVNSVFRATNPYGTAPLVSSGTTVRNIRMNGFSTATIVFDSCLIESLNGTNQNTAVDISTGAGHVQWHNCTIISTSTNTPGTYFTLKGGTHDIYGSSITTYPPSSGTVNFFGTTKLSSTNGYVANNVLTSDGTNSYWAPSTSGTTIPNTLGVVTNTVGGVVGVTVAIPTNWLNDVQGFMNAISNNAVSGLPNRTNYYRVTNAVAGNAVVVVGPDGNGQFDLKGTNWPTGGSGSDTPWSVNHNASGFRLDILTGMSLTNSGVASGMPFILGFDSTYGVALTLGAFTNDVAAMSALVASNIVGGTLVSTKGSVSLIPTNGAPVYTSNGLTGALPYGLTNTLQGRCQYLVGYYLVDAVGGTPILTVSNELDGYKYPNISVGASASVTPGTNWFTTPILSSNAVLRIRDESAGTGASVGLISSKQIGL